MKSLQSKKNVGRPALPTGWPRDKLSRVAVINGVAILTHRQRAAHTLSEDGRRWVEMGKVS